MSIKVNFTPSKFEKLTDRVANKLNDIVIMEIRDLESDKDRYHYHRK